MFTTYISKREDRSGVQDHETFGDALKAWAENCRRLQAVGGGNSVLVDGQTDDVLCWTDGATGVYLTGSMTARLSDVEPEEMETPEEVAEYLFLREEAEHPV